MNSRIFILILTLASITFMIGCTQKSEIPSFNILLIDSTSIFNTKDIPIGKASILIFFSPDCEHCQQETSDILRKMDSLKSVQFYFVSIDAMDRMRVFNEYYKINKYPNITIGRDYTYFFPGYFKDVSPPYSVVYDKYKRMRAVFKGASTATQLIALINNM